MTALAAVLLASQCACGGATTVASTQPTAPTAAQDCTSSTTNQTLCMPSPSPSISLSALPLGSAKVSTAPEQGNIWACQAPNGGNPVTIPPWVNTKAGTWSMTSKVAVEGDVKWHSQFKATHEGSEEVLQGNGLPARSGVFPVSPSDPAYAYNPDPTAISAHSVDVSLPYNPTVNASPQCTGAIVGVAINGIPILDGFDAGGNDAAAVETQDTCHGHPNGQVGYHYHSLSPCILSKKAFSHTTQVGWALDGFGIYVEYNAQGELLTNSDLDGCHGRTSVVPWHGKKVDIYHYDMTFEFPYTVGCFVGSPTTQVSMSSVVPPR
jgi:hypothetical protein